MGTVKEWLNLIPVKAHLMITLFRILEHIATITFCSGNGLLNAFSEGNELLRAAKKVGAASLPNEVVSLPLTPKYIHAKSFLFSFFNAVTTGAAAFNGTQIVFSLFISEKTVLKVMGAI